MAYLIVVLCAFLVSGCVHSRHINVEEDVTILIDFSKYQQIHSANVTNNTKSEDCTGLENAAYQKCGTKCVLACRFDPSISDVAATLKECDGNECIEGCFCNDGFVRYQSKCILPKECPVRNNKSIVLLAKKSPSPLEKRIIRPSCGSSNGSTRCITPSKPCLPFLCNNNSGNQNAGQSSDEDSSEEDSSSSSSSSSSEEESSEETSGSGNSSGNKESNNNVNINNNNNNNGFAVVRPDGSIFYVNNSTSTSTSSGNGTNNNNNNNNNNYGLAVVRPDGSIFYVNNSTSTSTSSGNGTNNNNNNNPPAFFPGGNIWCYWGYWGYCGFPGSGGYRNNGYPIWSLDKRSGASTAYHKAYSITYNQNGVRTVHIYGIGLFNITQNAAGPVNDGQPQNDAIDDDDGNKESPGNQANQKFVPIPSAANSNLPPIIALTLEMAAAAPPPPLPLSSSTNPLNSNSMPMLMQAMPNENSVVNAYNKPMLNDPVDAQSEIHTNKPSQPTELPIAESIAQNSAIPHGASSTNANSLTKPIDTTKPYKPTFVLANPLYQTSFYHQYNTFVPYGGFGYPVYQNIQFISRKNRNKSKEKSSKKSTPPKNIIINIS